MKNPKQNCIYIWKENFYSDLEYLISMNRRMIKFNSSSSDEWNIPIWNDFLEHQLCLYTDIFI